MPDSQDDQPGTVRASSSAYHIADIELTRYRYVNRIDTGTLSTTLNMYWHANLDVYSDTAQTIYVNGISLGLRNFGSSNGWIYNLTSSNITDSFSHLFDSIQLRVISPNNVDDLSFGVNVPGFYGGNIPFAISSNNDLVLPITGAGLANTDSVHLRITGDSEQFNVIVPISAGQLTITSSELQSLFPSGLAFPLLDIEAISHHTIVQDGRTFNISVRSYSSYQCKIIP